jgi:hypothetical protein
MPNPLSPFDFIQTGRTSAEETPASGNSSSSSGKSSGPGKPNVRQPKPDNVDELRNRVADLEKLVSKLAGSKKTRKRN